jgi:bacillithiol biosynthesis cysteine-adding enzyme BshC
MFFPSILPFFSMSTTSFESLGFSKLFVDFIANKEIARLRFPANAHLLSDGGALRTIASSNSHRALFLEAIESTMKQTTHTSEQQQNLQRLAEPNALTVITGQQVGFLGGALYTMLKAWTAVQVAQNLAATHTDLTFVPVFWIEDNDHDIDEISSVGMLNYQGEAFTVRSVWSVPPERVAASDVKYDDTLLATIEEVIEALPNSEYSYDIAEFLRTIYKPGAPVVQAFTALLQQTLGASGMLFVSAAELRKRGLFGQIAAKEIERPGATAETVAKASATLVEHGYHAQAQASAVNLFLHSDGKRHKINIAEGNDRFQAGEIIYTKTELLALVSTSPDQFSPSVLLRPVVQDSIFPNAAYIGGPGEIAYLAQIAELYDVFGVTLSATLVRHSATLLDGRTEQLCAKQGVSPTFFMRRYDDIEKEIMREQENKELAEELAATKSTIEHAFGRLQPFISALDATLAPTADRMKNQALQGVNDLEAKIRKAQKRLEETTLGKARKASALLFPDNGLQERTLPYIYFAAKIGLDALSAKMRHLTQEAADKHVFVVLDAE